MLKHKRITGGSRVIPKLRSKVDHNMFWFFHNIYLVISYVYGKKWVFNAPTTTTSLLLIKDIVIKRLKK